MQRNILTAIITYFFIFLLLYTGIHKLSDTHSFKEQLISSPLVGSIAGILAWTVPIGEVLLAGVLFIPWWRLQALYATAGLMSLFSLHVLVILYMDNQLTCSCGGMIEQLTPLQHVTFNIACAGLSFIGIWVMRKQQPTNDFTSLASFATTLLFATVAWFLISTYRAPAVGTSGLEGRVIPSLSLQLTDSTTWINTADIPDGKPFIVMGFSPTCGHCRDLTEDIKQKISLFKDIPIYFVTVDPFESMKDFYTYFELSKYHNIKMGRDTANIFFRYFNSDIPPLIAIYDVKKRLKKVLHTPATVDILVKNVNQ